MRTLLIALSAASLILTAPAVAQSSAAGSSQQGGGDWATLETPVAAAFSKQIENTLAEQEARLALVFRTGRPQDELPEGVRYTHGAFWVYSEIVADDGRVIRGYAVYNLYAGGDAGIAPDTSALVQDFPIDFTIPMAEAKAGIIIPSPEMQRRIYNLMATPTYAALHQPAYSLISNPHDLRHQNCNEFYLDVIAAAAWEIDDRAQIKSNLREYFTPQPIQTNVFQRMFGPMVNAMVKTNDHSGGIATTTFRSMAAFMSDYDLSSSAFEISYNPATGALGTATIDLQL